MPPLQDDITASPAKCVGVAAASSSANKDALAVADEDLLRAAAPLPAAARHVAPSASSILLTGSYHVRIKLRGVLPPPSGAAAARRRSSTANETPRATYPPYPRVILKLKRPPSARLPSKKGVGKKGG